MNGKVTPVTRAKAIVRQHALGERFVPMTVLVDLLLIIERQRKQLRALRQARRS